MKKFYLQSADSYIKIGNYDLAKDMIENCCNRANSQCEEGDLISKGDEDEILVYFLAFKLHCVRGQCEEALDMFE